MELSLTKLVSLIRSAMKKKTKPAITATPGVNQTYINTAYGFSINYPQDWPKTEESLKDAQDTSNYGNSHIPIQFEAPQTEPSQLVCNISVTVLDLSKMRQNFEQWSLGVISAADNASSDSRFATHLIESGSTCLSGYPGYRILYTNNLQKLESVRVWALVNGKVYDIAGAVFQPAKYDEYASTIQQMIDSFKIILP